MKRIVAFLDIFDRIPDNAKYLYSQKFELDLGDAVITPHLGMLYQHYYEVDDYDFQQLIEENFFKKTALEKMTQFTEFTEDNKVPNKDNDKD